MRSQVSRCKNAELVFNKLIDLMSQGDVQSQSANEWTQRERNAQLRASVVAYRAPLVPILMSTK